MEEVLLKMRDIKDLYRRLVWLRNRMGRVVEEGFRSKVIILVRGEEGMGRSLWEDR